MIKFTSLNFCPISILYPPWASRVFDKEGIYWMSLLLTSWSTCRAQSCESSLKSLPFTLSQLNRLATQAVLVILTLLVLASTSSETASLLS